MADLHTLTDPIPASISTTIEEAALDLVPASTKRSIADLPPETLGEILSYHVGQKTQDSDEHYMRSGYPTLLSACLVSKTWTAIATPILYRKLVIVWDSRIKHTLLKTLAEQPYLLANIRTIDVTYPSLTTWYDEFQPKGELATVEPPPYDENETYDEHRDKEVAIQLAAARAIGAHEWQWCGRRRGGLGERRRDGVCEFLCLVRDCINVDHLILPDFYYPVEDIKDPSPPMSLSNDQYEQDVIETITRHCPDLTSLEVGDLDTLLPLYDRPGDMNFDYMPLLQHTSVQHVHLPLALSKKYLLSLPATLTSLHAYEDPTWVKYGTRPLGPEAYVDLAIEAKAAQLPKLARLHLTLCEAVRKGRSSQRIVALPNLEEKAKAAGIGCLLVEFISIE
ncbi:hypothetical protein RQP46_010230 [Phenoliferia psychrophenolica]